MGYPLDINEEFVKACKNGDLRKVKEIFENNAKEPRIDYLNYVFDHACFDDDLTLVDFLVMNNTDEKMGTIVDYQIDRIIYYSGPKVRNYFYANFIFEK